MPEEISKSENPLTDEPPIKKSRSATPDGNHVPRINSEEQLPLRLRCLLKKDCKSRSYIFPGVFPGGNSWKIVIEKEMSREIRLGYWNFIKKAYSHVLSMDIDGEEKWDTHEVEIKIAIAATLIKDWVISINYNLGNVTGLFPLSWLQRVASFNIAKELVTLTRGIVNLDSRISYPNFHKLEKLVRFSELHQWGLKENRKPVGLLVAVDFNDCGQSCLFLALRTGCNVLSLDINSSVVEKTTSFLNIGRKMAENVGKTVGNFESSTSCDFYRDTDQRKYLASKECVIILNNAKKLKAEKFSKFFMNELSEDTVVLLNAPLRSSYLPLKNRFLLNSGRNSRVIRIGVQVRSANLLNYVKFCKKCRSTWFAYSLKYVSTAELSKRKNAFFKRRVFKKQTCRLYWSMNQTRQFLKKRRWSKVEIQNSLKRKERRQKLRARARKMIPVAKEATRRIPARPNAELTKRPKDEEQKLLELLTPEVQLEKNNTLSVTIITNEKDSSAKPDPDSEAPIEEFPSCSTTEPRVPCRTNLINDSTSEEEEELNLNVRKLPESSERKSTDHKSRKKRKNGNESNEHCNVTIPKVTRKQKKTEVKRDKNEKHPEKTPVINKGSQLQFDMFNQHLTVDISNAEESGSNMGQVLKQDASSALVCREALHNSSIDQNNPMATRPVGSILINDTAEELPTNTENTIQCPPMVDGSSGQKSQSSSEKVKEVSSLEELYLVMTPYLSDDEGPEYGPTPDLETYQHDQEDISPTSYGETGSLTESNKKMELDVGKSSEVTDQSPANHDSPDLNCHSSTESNVSPSLEPLDETEVEMRHHHRENRKNLLADEVRVDDLTHLTLEQSAHFSALCDKSVAKQLPNPEQNSPPPNFSLSVLISSSKTNNESTSAQIADAAQKILNQSWCRKSAEDGSNSIHDSQNAALAVSYWGSTHNPELEVKKFAELLIQKQNVEKEKEKKIKKEERERKARSKRETNCLLRKLRKEEKLREAQKLMEQKLQSERANELASTSHIFKLPFQENQDVLANVEHNHKNAITSTVSSSGGSLPNWIGDDLLRTAPPPSLHQESSKNIQDGYQIQTFENFQNVMPQVTMPPFINQQLLIQQLLNNSAFIVPSSSIGSAPTHIQRLEHLMDNIAPSPSMFQTARPIILPSTPVPAQFTDGLIPNIFHPATFATDFIGSSNNFISPLLLPNTGNSLLPNFSLYSPETVQALCKSYNVFQS